MKLRCTNGRWQIKFRKADGTQSVRYLEGCNTLAEAKALVQSLSLADLERLASRSRNAQRLLPALLSPAEAEPRDGVVDEFANAALRSDGSGERTAEIRREELLRFHRFLRTRRKAGPCCLLSPNSFVPQDIEDFVREPRLEGPQTRGLGGPELAPPERRMRLELMRQFGKWLQATGRRPDNPAASLRTIGLGNSKREKDGESAREVLSLEQIEKLLAGVQHPQLKVFIQWSWELGLGLGALSALRWEDQGIVGQLTWPPGYQARLVPLKISEELYQKLMRLPRTSRLIFPELHGPADKDRHGFREFREALTEELRKVGWQGSEKNAVRAIILAWKRHKPGNKLASDINYYRKRIAELEARVKELEQTSAHYYELIMEVASTWGGETRHETARRYIRERESGFSSSSASSEISPNIPTTNL
jgi:integrase